jgi:LacI family transcriptional regulator
MMWDMLAFGPHARDGNWISNLPSVPTLDDVARSAGVSTATVSRCLNSPERVVEHTRKRVMAAVEQLGYTPNFGARVMAAKRTFTIGAIIPTMENAIFARGLQAFQEALHARGYTLLVASSAYQPKIEEEQIRSLVARGADGLLLIGHDRDPAVYEYLRARSIPVLSAWVYLPDCDQPTVGFDNRASMRALAQKVIDFGHRSIAMISGITEGNDRAAARLAGLRDALSDNGLDPGAVPVIETPYEIENGSVAFRTLMQGDTRPSVVMCGNDVLAVGALRGAREIGLSVPDDVSITGFDDIELARIVEPQITTLHVPHREMGRRAAEALIDIVEKRNSGASIELQSSIQLRGSLRDLRV